MRSGYGLYVVKLLLIAPTCDRDDVGESWSTYQWVRRLSQRHETTLLTYNKRGHARASEQLGDVRVVEWQEPPGLGRAERLNSMLKPGYVPFYMRSRRWIRRRLEAGEQFDIAHQVSPLAMRYPSPVAGLGIPYVIGPVGGSLESPPGFSEGDTAPWYVRLRSLDRIRLRRDPLLRRTYEHASCVVGIAPYVKDSLTDVAVRRFAFITDTGIEQLPELLDHPTNPDQVRLLFVGRLIRTKGTRDAITAMSFLADLPVVFDIVGDGFDRQACEELVDALALRERVRFHGMRSRAQVADYYRDADIFVFPSYREPGGNVVYEAMSFSLPVVVCDRGGPGTVVDDSSGIRIHPESPDQYARAIADAVRRLVEDPILRRTLGVGAYKRVGDISLWERKVDTMSALYADILAGDQPH
jgi:glycosyltransferase involved in cell wall biosynthesis